MATLENTNIVFFHGFNSSANTDKFTCITHPNKQCVTVDYVGLGVDGVCDLYEEMIIDSMYKYDRTILVGHSFGAYFANMFAVKYGLRVLLIAPCIRPNVYLTDRMPAISRYNFIWESSYLNKASIMIENDDECFEVTEDVKLIRESDELKVMYFDGGHHRICRTDIINDEIDTLMK